MIGLVAKFTQQNALDFTQVNGRIKLFQVDDVTGNGFGIDRALRVPGLRAPILEARHALK